MTTPENDPRNQVAQEPPFDPEYDAAYDPVSYTHLTLPTILRV